MHDNFFCVWPFTIRCCAVYIHSQKYTAWFRSGGVLQSVPGLHNSLKRPVVKSHSKPGHHCAVPQIKTAASFRLLSGNSTYITWYQSGMFLRTV